MKKLIFILLLIPIVAFSQTPDPFPQWGNDLVKFIAAIVVWGFNNWDDVLGLFVAFLVALQSILRVIPTKKNWDFLALWIEWLNSKIPNRSSEGGVFVTKTTKEVDK